MGAYCCADSSTRKDDMRTKLNPALRQKFTPCHFARATTMEITPKADQNLDFLQKKLNQRIVDLDLDLLTEKDSV